jgi:hypothetical protein
MDAEPTSGVTRVRNMNIPPPPKKKKNQKRQAKQNIDETTDQFATTLGRLAAHCEFQNVNNEDKSAI